MSKHKHSVKLLKTRASIGRSLCASASLLAGILIVSAGHTSTQASTHSSARDFADLSLEELMMETVTSVSKREQRRTDSAAAVTVLTNDDLRRSGATTIPDALRMVPGLNVNSVNSSQWAVSARGFNQVFSNKLLVLMDGRSVYTPLFSGVYWDSLPTTLEDIDRIEVIRGPGATIWGANAVNGVINIVTRDARDTQGVMLYGGGGNLHPAMSGVRYGDQIGENTYYRVFGGYHSKDDYPLDNRDDAGDNG